MNTGKRNTARKVLCLVLAVLILLLAVLYFTRGSRRRRYGRSPRSYSSGYRGRRRR